MWVAVCFARRLDLTRALGRKLHDNRSPVPLRIEPPEARENEKPTWRSRVRRSLLVGALPATALVAAGLWLERRDAAETLSVDPSLAEPAAAVPMEVPVRVVRSSVPFAAAPLSAPLAANSVPGSPGAIRALIPSDPARALVVLAETEPRNRAEAEERVLLETEALIRLDRIAEARERASEYYTRYPNGAHKKRLEQLTGTHALR